MRHPSNTLRNYFYPIDRVSSGSGAYIAADKEELALWDKDLNDLFWILWLPGIVGAS